MPIGAENCWTQFEVDFVLNNMYRMKYKEISSAIFKATGRWRSEGVIKILVMKAMSNNWRPGKVTPEMMYRIRSKGQRKRYKDKMKEFGFRKAKDPTFASWEKENRERRAAKKREKKRSDETNEGGGDEGKSEAGS